MKNITGLVLGILMLFWWPGTNASAQTSTLPSIGNLDLSLVSKPPAKPDEVKPPGPLARNAVNIRAVRHFMRSFPTIDHEKWYTIKGGWMAKYTEKGHPVRVDYDGNGHWLVTIRYYTEDKLKYDIRSLVKSTWFDYHISFVEEFEVPGDEIFYIVHIHFENTWKLIRVYHGEAAEIWLAGKG